MLRTLRRHLETFSASGCEKKKKDLETFKKGWPRALLFVLTAKRRKVMEIFVSIFGKMSRAGFLEIQSEMREKAERNQRLTGSTPAAYN